MTQRRWWPSSGSNTTTRLWLGLGASILLLVVFSSAIIARVLSYEEQAAKLAQARGLDRAVKQLVVRTRGYSLAVREYSQQAGPQARQVALQEAEGVARQFEDCERLAGTDRQRNLLVRAASLWEQMQQLGNAALADRTGSIEPAASRGLLVLRGAMENLLNEAAPPEFTSANRARGIAALDDLGSIVDIVLVMLIAGVALALLTSGLVARVIFRSERKLWDSRERLRVALASIGDAVITTDTEDRVAYLNPAAEVLTGWQSAEAAGQPLAGVFRVIDQATREPVENPAEGALRENPAPGPPRPAILIAKDGTEIAVDDNAAPIRDERGAITGVILVFRDVSERRGVEDTLRQAHDDLERSVEARTAEIARANRFLHALLENLQEGIVACDADGVLTLFNRATREFHGLPQEAIKAENWADHYNLFRADGHTPMPVNEVPLFRALRGERVKGAEMVIAPKEGPARSLLANGQAFHDADGRLLGAVASMHDITRRKQAESALQRAYDDLESRVAERTAQLTDANEQLRAEVTVRQQAEEQLRHSETRKTAMFEAALDCIVSTNHDDVIVEFNAAAERTFGYRREEVLGRKMPDLLIPPAYRERHRTGLAHYLATGEGSVLDKRLELTALRADGSEFPVELTVTRIPLPGAPVFTAYMRDITEAKRAEGERQRAQERLRFVMDSMPQKIFTALPDGSVDYFNPPWMEFTGLSFEQMRDWGWTQLVHPDDLEENVRAWQHSIQTGEAFEFEQRFLRVDGRYRWHISRAVPLRDEAGRTRMWVGSNTDIDDQKQAADELRQLAAEMSDADRHKTEFLAVLAHELRNPLAPLSNAVQILRLANGDGKVIKSVTEVMERQLQQLVHLVDDLLDVSRISRGQIGLRREHVELATVIAQSVEASRPSVQCAGHDLQVTLPAQPVNLYADPLRLIQVFANLFNNACKFTDPGGRIALAAEVDGGEVVVTLSDSGIGIPADKLSVIFEMFTQVDQSRDRAHGGLGIGLTLVRQLVEMHGGTIGAWSEGEGRGSAFVVRLPVVGQRLDHIDTEGNLVELKRSPD